MNNIYVVMSSSPTFFIFRQLSSLTFTFTGAQLARGRVRSPRSSLLLLDRNISQKTFSERFIIRCSSSTCTHPRRTIMATTDPAPAKNEFLCIIPDKPGTLAKRLEVRPSHLNGAKPFVDSGIIIFGGAMLESHPAAGETPVFKGSALLVVGETSEDIKELLRKDVYTTSGVWDLDNVQIIPFKTALRAQVQ
ncbi:hypothetical protein Egran_00867 [Elaphomyces granulatus]|uniref:YCII-related domain-containing protein n=1 Tax=Elaphomyces granulatus TaxID=519963 RepID=A0A232M4V7_9EURO|nr:hypothetical protein Egran_00867 [Elaphomyces granulatus]